MTGMYENRHGVHLPEHVDGDTDPQGQALKDMDRAYQREEAAEGEGGTCYPWESLALKRAREELADEKRQHQGNRRVMEMLYGALLRAQAFIASELLRTRVTLDTKSHPEVKRIDRVLFLAKGKVSA